MSDMVRSLGGGVREQGVMEDWLDAVAAGRGGCLVVDRPGPFPCTVGRGIWSIVLRAAPDEALLAYAGLDELCRPFAPWLAQLPPIQQQALEGAIALGPPTGDALAVAAGFRTLLLLAAEQAPVLLVVEDAHLLDRGTATILAHCSRRLEGTAVALAITQDPTSSGALSLGAARSASVGLAAVDPPAVRPMEAAGAVRRARARASGADLAAALESAAAVREGPARWSDLLEAGDAWLDVGEIGRAQAAADSVRAESGSAGSAGAALLLGRIEAERGNGGASRHHLLAAADLASPDDPAVAVRALLLLVPPALFAGRGGDATAAVVAAHCHLPLLDGPEAESLCNATLAARTALAIASGRCTDISPIVDLLASPQGGTRATGDLSLLVSMVALPLIWRERQDIAGPLLREVIATLRAQGSVGALPMPLCALAVAERRAGRPTRSLIVAGEAVALAEATGQQTAWLFAQVERANAFALLGDRERCRAAAEAVLDSGTGRIYRSSALSALATVELWSGDPARAIELLEPLATGDALDPSVMMFQHTLAAAYVSVGRHADAEPLLRTLHDARPETRGRLRAAAAQCEALLAPRDAYDERFAEAIDACGDQAVSRGFTRLLFARRLLADGRTATAARLLRELADERDENLLGVVRSARIALTHLGLGVASDDPIWTGLSADELEVALAAADRTPVLTLADRLRLSPPEVERLRDAVLVSVGARSGPAVAAGLSLPSGADPLAARLQIRLVGGLAVIMDGEAVDLPGGAVATAIALLALRRAVHQEELAAVLWPEADAELGRRRLRNVLSRVRTAAGPLVIRQGDRLELAPEAVVDHHVFERQASQVLALASGTEQRAAAAAALAADQGPLLPEAAYEEWAQPAQRRTKIRRADLAAVLHGTGSRSPDVSDLGA